MMFLGYSTAENFSGSLTLNSNARYFENGRFTAFSVMLEDLKDNDCTDNAL